MTISEMIGLIGVLVVALTITHGRAAYWKSRAETIDKERSVEGWRNETMFWRRHFNAEAAEWTEDNA